MRIDVQAHSKTTQDARRNSEEYTSESEVNFVRENIMASFAALEVWPMAGHDVLTAFNSIAFAVFSLPLSVEFFWLELS